MKPPSLIVLLALVAASAPAGAQVALSNVVHVEDAASGQRKASSAALRGDGLVYVFTYRNTGVERIQNYTINHPLVPTAEFVGQETGAPLMSVDKGVTFAPLAELRVRAADGSERPALPRDVTHLRWRIPTIIEPGASGEVSYRARLR